MSLKRRQFTRAFKLQVLQEADAGKSIGQLAREHQVEIWFNIITQKAIRRGSFRSVKELIERIELHVPAIAS